MNKKSKPDEVDDPKAYVLRSLLNTASGIRCGERLELVEAAKELEAEMTQRFEERLEQLKRGRKATPATANA